jgi:hypothetical protein
MQRYTVTGEIIIITIMRHPQHTQSGSKSSTIAADSSNDVTNTRCCRYSCICSWWWMEVPPEASRAVSVLASFTLAFALQQRKSTKTPFKYISVNSCYQYIKHHCKGRLLQRHPEAVRPCKSVCTVRKDVCRKLDNKRVISFTQILFS